MTNKSTQQLGETAKRENPILNELDPSVFEVSAKKNAAIWSSQQYKDPEFRAELMAPDSRVKH